MSEIDGSELAVGELPTGTVTLLLADVEGSTRLWQTRPEEMAAAIARLDAVLAGAVAAHHGVRPVEQGEGDSFVIAFARASDALGCALELQRAPLAPIALRIGVHTGEVRLRDHTAAEGNYVGPAINRTARLRDLAHGGQTVISGATEPLVADVLPADVTLTDLGSHPLRDLPRPERVVQVCHPDLRNDFPPLRVTKAAAAHNLPAQLTTFVGRQAEITDLRATLDGNRLVTLTGAGGAGKTRLAVQVAAQLAEAFADGICYVDLAPITHPDVVAVTAARALGLPDQPGRSTMDTLLWFLRERRMLIVLDNCEHLLEAGAALCVGLLGGAPGLTLLATSREPLGVPGEATWQVPSLSLADDAVALFTDRARLARAGFHLTDDNAGTVAEICERLDGMPLAIELAAARVRALSLTEILDSLHDRFRLLTGGGRISVRRQQTLRASVDWSHALLTDTERLLFRRLAVFLGGFDLAAAQAIAGADDLQRYQVLDQLTLLVDKSLVVADDTGGATRYRLLETMRQYALEKLGESGDAAAVRSRHRDHYTAMAARLDAPAERDHEQRLHQAETEMDNLRGAFGWSLETSEIEQALRLASALQPLFLISGRVREGLAWLNTALAVADTRDVAATTRAQALADSALLAVGTGMPVSGENQAQQAVALARDIGDPALLTRTLAACGISTAYDAELAEPYFAEAVVLARTLDDRWRLSQILGWQANAAILAGDPKAARAAAQEGLDLAVSLGDRFDTRRCRFYLGVAQYFQGELSAAIAQFATLIAESEAAHDQLTNILALGQQGYALAYRGDTEQARAAAAAALAAGAQLGDGIVGFAHLCATIAALAAGDVATAQVESESARRHLSVAPGLANVQVAYYAQAALAAGDLDEARLRADAAVSPTTGSYSVVALITRARVAIARGELDQAERDAHEALVRSTGLQAMLCVPDALECLATLAADADKTREAVRLLGAAAAIRQRTGEVRFKVWDADYQASAAALREALGDNDFDAAWAEGAALSDEEAIGYARRGRGERKRPASGWASLTPAELDVVRLVGTGLGNGDIAARLFVSPRTVQAHLTHVYAKLGLTSRVQLAQEAAQHQRSGAHSSE